MTPEERNAAIRRSKAADVDRLEKTASHYNDCSVQLNDAMSALGRAMTVVSDAGGGYLWQPTVDMVTAAGGRLCTALARVDLERDVALGRIEKLQAELAAMPAEVVAEAPVSV